MLLPKQSRIIRLLLFIVVLGMVSKVVCVIKSAISFVSDLCSRLFSVEYKHIVLVMVRYSFQLTGNIEWLEIMNGG